MNNNDQAALERLTKEVERLNAHRFIRVQNSYFRLILFQFIPIIGDWAAQIAKQIELIQ